VHAVVGAAADAVNLVKQWECNKWYVRLETRVLRPLYSLLTRSVLCSAKCIEKISTFAQDVVTSIAGKAIQDITAAALCVVWHPPTRSSLIAL
jgi:hypothetical protein